MDRTCQELKENGIEVDRIIAQLGNNETVYLAICRKFCRDQNIHLFQKAIRKQDYQNAVMPVHTLKGMAANLGFVKLEQITGSLLMDLKKEDYQLIEQKAAKLMEAYQVIVRIIEG